MTTTLLRGGRVLSPADPFATALLVDNGLVAWVGSDAAATATGADVVVDLDDAVVLPAFVDAHVHATATGLALTGLDLSGATSLAAALAAVERAAAAHGAAQVLLGTGWDETRWPERRPPTAAELDRAGGDRPVYLSRADLHSAVASSTLLRRAGIGPDGHRDGLVRLADHHAVRAAALAAVSSGQQTAAQEATLRAAAALGIAVLHEMAGPEVSSVDDAAALRDRAGDPAVPAVSLWWGELGPAGIATAQQLGARGAGGDLFCDGSLGSCTAALRDPYQPDAGVPPGPPAAATAAAAETPWRGALRYDSAAVAAHVAAAVQVGLGTGFHAIGDAALDAVVAGYRQARDTLVAGGHATAGRPLPGLHRVEHAELLDDALIAAIAELGLVASVQPAFDARWGGPDGLYAERLGAQRAVRANPLAALVAAGVPLAFGSDAPVTPLDPWGALRAAVRPQVPAHALSARAAFSAHTRGGHRAAGDVTAGTLVPGAAATFAVWRVDGELVVQVPAADRQQRAAAFSTDPRAAVPGLPDLTGPDPVCLATVRDGVRIHDTGALAGWRDAPSTGVGPGAPDTRRTMTVGQPADALGAARGTAGGAR